MLVPVTAKLPPRHPLALTVWTSFNGWEQNPLVFLLAIREMSPQLFNLG